MFQTRHYKVIAAVLKTCPRDVSTELIVRKLAATFKKDNAAFDKDKFIVACDI